MVNIWLAFFAGSIIAAVSLTTTKGAGYLIAFFVFFTVASFVGMVLSYGRNKIDSQS